MNKEFVPYEQALALKELGFDEQCFGAFIGEKLKIFSFSNDLKGYVNDANLIIGAPTYQQAFRWFREKYNLLSEIGLRDREDLSTWKFEITIIGKYEMKHNSISYNTHEEAELACLIKLIKIVKNEN